MMRGDEIEVMVPKETEEKAIEALGGISLGFAIRIYLEKIAEAGRIPFDMPSSNTDLNSPKILHPKVTEDGAVVVTKEWFDDEGDLREWLEEEW